MSDLRERTWTSSGSKPRWQTLHRSMRSRTMRLICLSVSIPVPVAFVGGAFRSSIARFALEVVEVERVDEVAEDREPLFVHALGPLELRLGGDGLAFAFVVVGAQHDPGLFHHRVLDEDGYPGAHGECDGIAGPRVDLYLSPVLAQHDAGIEDVIGEIRHRDPF